MFTLKNAKNLNIKVYTYTEQVSIIKYSNGHKWLQWQQVDENDEKVCFDTDVEMMRLTEEHLIYKTVKVRYWLDLSDCIKTR